MKVLTPIRTGFLAVIGAFGGLYLVFYLHTRWGPSLPDASNGASAISKQIKGFVQESMDASLRLTPNGWNGENYWDAIGIQFGNDYSRVGIFKDNQSILIANDEGQTKIPNYVTLTDQEVIAGFKAKEEADSNTENAIYNFRNLLGRKFPDTSLQQEIGFLPYKVVEKDSRPFIQVQINGTDKLYAPEEITAEILKRMKTAAEHWISHTVTNAVVSVPAYFNDAQRQAIRDASAIAGLNVLRLIDEPKAVGFAYRLDRAKHLEKNHRVWKEPIKEGLHGNGQFEAPAVNCLGSDDEYCYLVFNIEERGCDLTITSVDEGVFEELINLKGDFGTRDFDHDLFRYLFKLAHKGVAQFEIGQDFEWIDRLNLEAKQAQETLLTFPYADINISSQSGEEILSTIVTREKAQELHTEESDYKVIGLVEKVLLDANLEKRAIDGLIVTGDPIYAAKIQSILQRSFEGAKLHSDIKSDEIIVRGVARMAGTLSGEYSDWCGVPIAISPLSVGIETAGGLYTKVILRNSIVPTRKTKHFIPAGNSQKKMVLKIYEGERELVKYNRFLGTLELDRSSRTQSGEVEIEVTFEMTDKYQLTVTAKEKGFDEKAEVVFDEGTLWHERWQEEVDDILMEAEKNYEEDLQEKEKAIAEDSWKQDHFGVVDVV